MKFHGLTRNVTLLSLSALCSGALVLSCTSGGGGGKGGDGGGSGGDGGGGDGGESSSGGKGGAAAGGKGGSGGSASGGGGGVTMTGGAGGVGMTGGMMGTGGMVSAGAPKWCTLATERPGVNSGTQTLPIGQINAPEPNAAGVPVGEIKSIGGSMVYVPAQYASAKAGEVGLVVLLASYNLDVTLTKKLDQAIAAKEIPPILVAKTALDGDNVAGVLSLIDAIKSANSKITDSKMIATAGQSTAGAQAFDIAWNNPQKVGGVIAASGSFVCFRGSGADQQSQNNKLYADKIAAAAKKDIRVTMIVSTCDIFGTQAARLATTCTPGDQSGSFIDASGCEATWQEVNIGVADALKSKGYDYQLVIGEKLPHLVMNPAGFMNQVRWLFRPQTCK